MVFGFFRYYKSTKIEAEAQKGYSYRMTKEEPELPLPSPPTEAEVRAWLLEHPDFLAENPEILTHLTPPEAQQGENVEDFQAHMLHRLQSRQRELKDDLEELIGVTRDNISTQAQVNKAILALVKTESLEQLLQTVTEELTTIFDVDAVRLAVETPLADQYETQYSEASYSGIGVLMPGGVDAAIGQGQNSFTILDTRETFPQGTKAVFEACEGLIRSCILLRMDLPHNRRQGVLGFGVRYAGRFHPAQSDELLQFLAKIVSLRLEPLLRREGLDEF